MLTMLEWSTGRDESTDYMCPLCLGRLWRGKDERIVTSYILQCGDERVQNDAASTGSESRAMRRAVFNESR